MVRGLLFATAMAASGMFAQSPNAPSPATRPAFDEFEVATVKPTAADWQGGRYMRMLNAHQFSAKGYALRVLVAGAYNLPPQAISGGPAWLDSDLYDVLAEAPGDVRPTLEEQMSMLRKLIVERFNLSFHREPKELSIYAMTVAKSGLKMAESTISPEASPEGPPPLVFFLSPQGARLPGRNATLPALAAVMQRTALDRPVVDKTGLSGRYDFDLEFMPDETQFGGAFRGPGNTDDPNRKPDLFAAIEQQLGLRLEAARGPVDTMVIDRVERPSAN